MKETIPSWKFWHPVPFWQVLVLWVVAVVVGNLFVVFLREVLHLGVPTAAGGLVGGLLGVLATFARKKQFQS